MRGYAVLLGDDAVVIVHPDAEGEGSGTVLRRWAEARAAERGTAVLRQFAYGGNDGARAHLREAGYAPAQHYFRLRADLDAVPTAPDAPLRTFDAARDEESVHALIQDAFADIEGHEFQPLEAWRAKSIAKDGHDPRCGCCCRTMRVSSERRSASAGRPAPGYVAELAVAARARGRGHGRTLLLGLFDAFRRAGLDARRAERARA